MPLNPRFESTKSLDERKLLAARLRQKNTDRIPVIVQPAVGCRLPALATPRLLLPKTMTMHQLFFYLRQRLDLPAGAALICFVGQRSLLQPGATIFQADRDYASEDGILYVDYAEESAFG